MAMPPSPGASSSAIDETPLLSVKELGRTGCLSGVTADFWRGRLTAVLGPSGAGKTTFFSVLSGRLARTSGSVLLNGTPTVLSDHAGLLAFATEAAPLAARLTVEESLLAEAAVRLPAVVSAPERLELVRRIMAVLRLEHVAQARVGSGAAFGAMRGVSFGERRRLSIGIEKNTQK